MGKKEGRKDGTSRERRGRKSGEKVEENEQQVTRLALKRAVDFIYQIISTHVFCKGRLPGAVLFDGYRGDIELCYSLNCSLDALYIFR